MIRNIKRQWFEVWGQEEAQNRFLKYLLAVFGGLTVTLVIALSVVSLRRPPVIFVDPDAALMFIPSEPDAKSLEREVIRILKKYLVTRNNWSWETVEAQTRSASSFVASDFREKYLLATSEQIQLAKEKQVTQKMFPDDPKVDLKNKTATVATERILVVGGIRASSSMTFALGFSYGDRTTLNPEGVYITSVRFPRFVPVDFLVLCHS